METRKLKLEDITIGGKVRHHNASPDSPNHIGTIVHISMASNPVLVNVKFRDFFESYSLRYVLTHYIP